MLIHILVIVILHIPLNDNTEACMCLELHMSSNQERDWSSSWRWWLCKPFHQHDRDVCFLLNYEHMPLRLSEIDLMCDYTTCCHLIGWWEWCHNSCQIPPPTPTQIQTQIEGYVTSSQRLTPMMIFTTTIFLWLYKSYNSGTHSKPIQACGSFLIKSLFLITNLRFCVISFSLCLWIH